MKKKEKINYTVPILFLLYLALLIWIILFKLQFSILDLDRVREINLIPFYYEHEVTFHATEVLQNVLIFMPFGIYLCLLLPKSRFGVKVLLISVVSLLLEWSDTLKPHTQGDIIKHRKGAADGTKIHGRI